MKQSHLYGQETMERLPGRERSNPSAVKVLTGSGVKAELHSVKEQGDDKFDFEGIQ